MPRHPPIALKTLDRSHCQYPSRNPQGIVVQAKPLARFSQARSRRDRRFSNTLCGVLLNGIGTKRPASRDRFEGAVRQTHHMQGIERPLRQIMALSDHEVRTNLLFTMSNRTGGEPRSSPQTHMRMTRNGNYLYPTPTQQSRGSREDTTILSDRVLVEPDGIEPTTSCLQSRRSPS